MAHNAPPFFGHASESTEKQRIKNYYCDPNRGKTFARLCAFLRRNSIFSTFLSTQNRAERRKKTAHNAAPCLRKEKPGAQQRNRAEISNTKNISMSKVRYYLKTPKSERSRILLTLHYPGGKLVYYTGDVVEPKHWNTQTERLRKNAPGGVQINTGLDRLENIALEIFRQYRNEGKPLPPELFREELNREWKGKAGPDKNAITLFEFWQTLIDERGPVVPANYGHLGDG